MGFYVSYNLLPIKSLSQSSLEDEGLPFLPKQLFTAAFLKNSYHDVRALCLFSNGLRVLRVDCLS
jgi:hypothetical protein